MGAIVCEVNKTYLLLGYLERLDDILDDKELVLAFNDFSRKKNWFFVVDIISMKIYAYEVYRWGVDTSRDMYTDASLVLTRSSAASSSSSTNCSFFDISSDFVSASSAMSLASFNSDVSFFTRSTSSRFRSSSTLHILRRVQSS